MNLLDKAISIAIEAHAGQVNHHDGEVYLLHPQRVAIAVRDAGYSMPYQATAWLHDILEDSSFSNMRLASELQPFLYGSEVWQAVNYLTKVKGELNITYLHRLKKFPIPQCVKWYDSIGDNLRRTENIKDEATRNRLRNKYALAANILEGPGPVA